MPALLELVKARFQKWQKIHFKKQLHLGQGIHEWTKQNLWKTAFKIFEVIWSALADLITSNFLKGVFHKFYLVRSWIPWPICSNLLSQTLMCWIRLTLVMKIPKWSKLTLFWGYGWPISCHQLLSTPPENIRKPEVFWCFHGV